MFHCFYNVHFHKEIWKFKFLFRIIQRISAHQWMAAHPHMGSIKSTFSHTVFCTFYQPLWCWNKNFLWQLSHYHDLAEISLGMGQANRKHHYNVYLDWSLTLLCQVISNHSIDYEEWMSPCLPWGRISITCSLSILGMGWVGLWGFLWWAPSAKGKDHHGVSSGWSSVWHRSNTGLSSTQYEQIPIILGVWPFWLTPFFFQSITFWQAYG